MDDKSNIITLLLILGLCLVSALLIISITDNLGITHENLKIKSIADSTQAELKEWHNFNQVLINYPDTEKAIDLSALSLKYLNKTILTTIKLDMKYIVDMDSSSITLSDSKIKLILDFKPSTIPEWLKIGTGYVLFGKLTQYEVLNNRTFIQLNYCQFH